MSHTFAYHSDVDPFTSTTMKLPVYLFSPPLFSHFLSPPLNLTFFHSPPHTPSPSHPFSLPLTLTGHLLPMDLPAQALEMFRRFLEAETFHDVTLPTDGESCNSPLFIFLLFIIHSFIHSLIHLLNRTHHFSCRLPLFPTHRQLNRTTEALFSLF
jgi:hypothetical protein